MDTAKTARLNAVLAELQQRWGSQVIYQAASVQAQQSVVSTGFAALDQVLEGGIPIGQASELFGRPTSGMTTLAYKIIASAQLPNAYGIYIDLDSTFDPDYAARCGIVLERLFVARPETDLQALDIARDLLDRGSVAVIVLDTGTILPTAIHLRRLTTTMTRSGSLLLWLLTLPHGTRLPASFHSPAALRLLVEWRGWLERQSDIRGYRAGVTILKHHTVFDQQVEINIDFDDNIAGEPL